jgi:hypothetical protein
MNTTNPVTVDQTLIVKCFPRMGLECIEAEQWQLLKDARGFYCQEWFDVNKLTNDERVAYEADLATLPEGDPDEAAYWQAQIPRFPTPELAEEWAALRDAIDNISADMSAFGAPSECYALAYEPLEAKEAALLAKAI